ncbi:prepilin-type cleavage/methylation domain-containing protein [Paenibacillus sambharensis]|uniref:Prepilin-type cleavage/methylation domain-containing protein n=1 Tax=Paenibacillus sambharensis TaxID=1803190 RepID=A0A2W1L263_9BACL|nr:type II secretion system protein [Paenibacillus sambharensis]PZD93143.1 prepilin-type cleavage/methylation domain-containing protein [Paenibacillus sambharensis]
MQMVMKRLKKEEKGFTLIELLAVIVILGVIAAIAVPLIGNIISNSKEKSDIAAARQVYEAARLYLTAENNGETKGKKVEISALKTADYLDERLVLPSSKKSISGGEVQFKSTGDLLYVSLVTSDGTVYYEGTVVMAGEGDKSPNKPTETTNNNPNPAS